MQARLLPFLSLVCLALCGCSAYSVHPLYTSQDAVVEPALPGTWVSPDPNDKGELSIQKSGPHEYTLAMSMPDQSVQTYKLNLVRLGDRLFADMIFSGQTAGGKNVDQPVGLVPMHIILKLDVAANELKYTVLDQDALKKLNAQGSPPLEVLPAGDDLIITANTDSLRRYISVHATDLFPADLDHLKRKD
jgi:hypothetical protein